MLLQTKMTKSSKRFLVFGRVPIPLLSTGERKKTTVQKPMWFLEKAVVSGGFLKQDIHKPSLWPKKAIDPPAASRAS